MNIISSPNMPKSNGHYSHCVEHNGALYISGQLPLKPDKSIPEGIVAQTDLVLERLEKILLAAGSSKYQVLQVRIYIPDVELWDKVNERYSLFFESHKPARCVVPTNELHYGSLIELEAIAFVK